MKRKKYTVVHVVDDKAFVAIAKIKKNKPTVVKYLNNINLEEQEITDFVKSNKLKKSPVLFAVGGKQIISRIITIPEMSENEIKQALKFEITKYIPIPTEEIIFDYEIIGKISGTVGSQLRLLLVAARKELLEKICDLFVRAGLIPRVVDIEGTIINNLYRNLDKQIEDEKCCCIYLEEGRAVFSFIVDKKVCFIHNVDFETEALPRLLAEYQRVSNYIIRQFQLDEINNIYLFGPAGKDDVALFLQNETGLNTAVGVLKNDLFTTEQDIQVTDNYHITLGLILREVQK